MSLFQVDSQWFEVILPGKARFTICADEESGFYCVRVSFYTAVATIGVVFVFADFENGAV